MATSARGRYKVAPDGQPITFPDGVCLPGEMIPAHYLVPRWLIEQGHVIHAKPDDASHARKPAREDGE